MDYIETEMAKRSQQRHFLPSHLSGTSTPPIDEATGEPFTSNSVQREPATLGKLHEIDLGYENRIQNIARTQAATRRLVGGEDQQDTGSDGKKTTGGRGQEERSVQSIERDRLVEEVLRESRCMDYSFLHSLPLTKRVLFSNRFYSI